MFFSVFYWVKALFKIFVFFIFKVDFKNILNFYAQNKFLPKWNILPRINPKINPNLNNMCEPELSKIIITQFWNFRPKGTLLRPITLPPSPLRWLCKKYIWLSMSRKFHITDRFFGHRQYFLETEKNVVRTRKEVIWARKSVNQNQRKYLLKVLFHTNVYLQKNRMLSFIVV